MAAADTMGAPDPRSLWKNIPSSGDIPFPKADDAAPLGFAVPEDGLLAACASVRGRKHAHTGLPRDDDFCLGCTGNGWILLATADGAGASPYSRRGSEVAVRQFRERAGNFLEDDRSLGGMAAGLGRDGADPEPALARIREMLAPVMREAVHESRGILSRDLAAVPGADLGAFDTTLQFAALKRLDGGFLILSFAVGDGVIAVYDPRGLVGVPGDSGGDSHVLLLNRQDSGEYAGETRFVTSEEVIREPDFIASRVEACFLPDFGALFLMTDGVSDAKFETMRDLHSSQGWDRFWDDLTVSGGEDSPPVDLLSPAPEVAAGIGGWLNFWARGCHDDRTLAAVFRQRPA